jgi:predicted DNA-binding protein YlxM (UPF0122 family)
MSTSQRIWDQLDPDWLTTKYHRDRLTIVEIADLAGVGRQTVYHALIHYNIPRREPKRRFRTIDAPTLWRKYWLLGMTMTDIARQTNRNRSSIHRDLNKHGIPRRPRHEQWNACLPPSTLYIYSFQSQPIYLRLSFNGCPPCPHLYDEITAIPIVDARSEPPQQRTRQIPLVGDWLADLLED